MQEYASNGIYYFKRGSYVKKFFQKLIDDNISFKGEYYVSLVYNLLASNGLKVSIYEIQHMLQWGTPQDFEEYTMWSKYFSNILEKKKKLPPKIKSITLIPLAGRGSRFSTLGYKKPKPLLEVSGKPMIIQAANSLPQSQKLIFVALKEHLKNYPLKKVLKDEFTNPKIVSLEGATQGQAITCFLGLKDEDINSSLLIAATDNSIMYDQNKYQKLIEDKNVDAIIFTFRNHVSSKSNPQMYGWVKTDYKNKATGVSVKVPISKKIHKDHAIVGTFWFKKVQFFNLGLKNLIDKNIKINNEYYVDSLMGELINLGLNVKVFEVDNYLCWGTPNDYEIFIYWQSFFHKAQWHPYNLQKDSTVNKEKIEILKKKYMIFKQKHK
jgi:hypothetical protein